MRNKEGIQKLIKTLQKQLNIKLDYIGEIESTFASVIKNRILTREKLSVEETSNKIKGLEDELGKLGGTNG